MSKWNKKAKFVSLYEFNKYLKMSEALKIVPYDPKDTDFDKLAGRRFLWVDNRSNQHLIFRDYSKEDGKAYHVALDLYDMKAREDDAIEGWEAFKKALNPFILGYKEDIWLEGNDDYLKYITEQYQYCNMDYRDMWLKCYSYDINSCFLSFLSYPLPDNHIKREWGIVEKGEIGFIDQDGYLVMVKKGKTARWIFDKRIYSSLAAFQKTMYENRLNSKTSVEKEFWKDCVVKSIGYLKYVNVFLRSAILNYARERIVKLKDKNTIFCNTDSITSIVPRDDLDFGDKIGQFKVEHNGELFIFRSIGLSVWYGERVKYRGMKQSYVNEDEEKYWIYSTEACRYDYKTNRMIITNKKGVIENLWEKPKKVNMETNTTLASTLLIEDLLSQRKL